MPRARTIAVAAFVALTSLGIGAGLAVRWLLREMLIAKSGRAPTLAAVLRPRGTEGRALLLGVAFLPIFWGGFLTFMSPLMLGGGAKPISVVIPWIVTLLLALLMRVLYGLAWPWRGEIDSSVPADEDDDEHLAEAGRAAWRRANKVTLWCGLPGLALCSITMVGGWPEAFAILAFLAVIPALFAPWIGALAALPVLERASLAPSRVELPARPHAATLRLLAIVVALGLGALWAEQLRAVVAPPPNAPLLRDGDFDQTRCYGGYDAYAAQAPSSPEDLVRARLAGAGIDCGPNPVIGEVELDDEQRLAWCTPADPQLPTRFVALGRADEELARRDVTLEATPKVPSRKGVIAVAGGEAGMRVVRIGRDAEIDASWPLPRADSHSILSLHAGPRGRVVVAWAWSDGVAVAMLDEDLAPIAPVRVAPGPHRYPNLAVGARSACVEVYGPTRGTFVVDHDGRVHLPSLGERLQARGASVFHVGWTGLVLLVTTGIALGAGRMRRRIARSTSAGAVSEGVLTEGADGTTSLRSPDGDVARVVTDRAEWHGFADAEPHDGPCTIVGVARASGGTAYRSAPTEIDAPVTFAIVRGDLVQARAWAAGHRDRVRLLALAVALMTTLPTLLYLLLP